MNLKMIRRENQQDRASLSLFALTIPIVLENLFRIFISSIDIFMLSGYSQEAVAGVGIVNQYIFFIQLLFNIVCIGTSIVLAQYLGAKRHTESVQVIEGSIILVLAGALGLLFLILVGAQPLLSLYKTDSIVRSYAITYLKIFGGFGSIFVALNMLQGTVLRAYGHTRDTMIVTFVANGINVIGNAISLYGPFGLPVFGVLGVAVSSVISQIAACGILALRIRKYPEVQFRFSHWKAIPPSIFKTIVRIGLPSAGESLSYNVAQIVIMALVATFGTASVSSVVYAQTIVRFVFILPMSIGTGVQIKVGYLVGAGQFNEAYHRLYRYQAIGTFLALGIITVLQAIKVPIIMLFTHDPVIMATTSTLLLYSYYIEFGRSINLITISALKGAGDVRFPVGYGIFSMWCIMVLGAYLFGYKAGYGLIAIWLAIGTDETLRGFVMLGRWKSKRWVEKRLT
ncbi:MAG: MATE family efflux transporter [Treponemataceae bacterium]|nr:MATE family efflux transporter [Treponemataceae bacterium]